MSGSLDGPDPAVERSVPSIRVCLPLDVVAPLAPRLGDRAQELREARDPVPRLGREVRARVERLRVRRHEDRRRPAARPGHPDSRLHRHRVHVRALLAIDLHVHEELVHERRGRLRLERLVRHHVAPVARAVADRDEERLVLGPSALERLVAPLVPVDRVLGVLEEIRRGRAGESIHVVSVRARLSASGRCEMIARHEEKLHLGSVRRRRHRRPRRPPAVVHDRGVRPERRGGCARRSRRRVARSCTSDSSRSSSARSSRTGGTGSRSASPSAS